MSGLSVQPAVGVFTRNLVGSSVAPVVPIVTPAGATKKSIMFREGHLSLSFDWAIRQGTKTISGVIYGPGGSVVSGATVQLIREADNRVVATTTTNGAGQYSFVRDVDDPFTYQTKAFTAANAPQIHGVSDRGLAPQ